ncbi:S-layer homology domain-containing protein [Desulfolucanica intricata]|uniref:S-layer homology domain-containing protein n=1 Tax=Desulfolucanica intricata TaxID=1285191 RepID=UPI000A730514|nr:S-layer homology domain-containing protein [Desulfolucanica intricata]
MQKSKKVFPVLLITTVFLLAGLLQPKEFQVPAGAEPAAAFPYQFKDIDNHPWGAEYLEKMVRLGILKGYGEKGVYYSMPEKVISRAEFATLLARTLGLPEKQGTLPFADQKSIPGWARGSALALYDEGIVTGSPSAGGRVNFKPNDNISRAEIVAMITRALSSETIITGENPFRDVKQGDWFYEEVLTANNLGIVNGRTAKTFVPYGTAKRVEVMAILSRFLEKDNGELPLDEKLVSVVEDFYDEVEEILEEGGDRDRLSRYVTGEMALGLKSEGAGLLESISLEDDNVRFYPGTARVAAKSSRLAEVEISYRVKMPEFTSSIWERCYLVRENTKWVIFASDITSVDTEEQ